MPTISIIVPVYNVEKYLRQCLDSLINQTFEDIEIICINDGSTDNSLEILKEYEQIDQRIKVINQENQGVSSAKNNGIKIAKGEYLAVVDGDDWVEPDAYEILLSAMKKHNVDVVMFSYFRNYGNVQLEKKVFDSDKVFEKNDCANLHRSLIGIVGQELSEPQNAGKICSSWTKLYKTDIIKENKIFNIDLDIIGTYEDGMFNLEYFKYVNKAIYINKCLYHYRKTNENSITTVYRPRLQSQWDNLYDIIKRHIDENGLGDDYKKAMQNRIALDIIGLGFNVLAGSGSVMHKVKEIKAILQSAQYKAAVKQLDVKFMPLHWKVFFICCKLRLSFPVFFLLLIMNHLRGRV
ncbi:MAG: putative glycosyltransferase EpsJ [Firmicutes bacterium ADurb.Bin193]|nr:MAG: putative glycosyltransferase EpsJ [Firmicutes bacterium ADurb.Bin193]